MTEHQRENLHPRIFAPQNVSEIFRFHRIILDAETLDFYERDDTVSLTFTAQFEFAHSPRGGGAERDNSNIQHVEMVFGLNRHTREYEWLVDYSMLLTGVELGPKQVELVM